MASLIWPPMAAGLTGTILSIGALFGSSAFIAQRKQLFGRKFDKINTELELCGIVIGAAAAASIGYVATNGLKEIQKTDKQKPQTDMHRSFNASGAKQETVFVLKNNALPFKCAI